MADKKHTDLSPSNAERWMNCPGSVALCKKMPKPPQSEHAAEGQAAHALLERCLKNPKINPFDLVGETIEEFEVTDEMAEAVSYACATVRTELQKGGTLLVEQKVTVIPELIGGTLDIAIVREFDRIIVMDFKYGKGILVSATDNRQLLLYALALTKQYEVEKIQLTIIQPRTETMMSTWECDMKYMDGFEAQVGTAINLAQEKDAFTCAGSWCRWCYAKTICPALRKDLAAQLPAANKELIFPDVKALAPETLKNILDYKDRFETWLNAVAAYSQEYIEAGGSIEGYDLAKKRAWRKWINEDEALKAFADLGDQAFKIKLLSPAQMEKIAGKERVSKLTEVPETGMTLKKIGEKK